MEVLNLKKHGLLCVVALLGMLYSCNNVDSILDSASTDKISNLTVSDNVNLDFNMQTRDMYKVSLTDVHNLLKAYGHISDFRIEPVINSNDTLMYLINFKEGWIIAAGDRRLSPIIAESDSGQISSTAGNKNLAAWIENCKQDTKGLVANDNIVANSNSSISSVGNANKNGVAANDFVDLWSKISPNKTAIRLQNIAKAKQTAKTKSSVEYKWAVVSYTYAVSTTSNIVIDHLTNTEWGQGNPWNNKLPIDKSNENRKCATGCTAVAIAQMLYYTHNYLGKPNGLYHNISASPYIAKETSNIGFTRSNYVANSTRWNDMPLNGRSQGNADYVSDLMMDIGNNVGMSYSAEGSGAGIKTEALAKYNLTYTKSDYNYQKIKTNLQNSKPVIVIAYRKDENGNKKGHTWIIDGLATKTTHFITEKHFEYTENWMNESEYYNSFDELRWKYNINSEFDTVKENSYSTAEYLLMNWGYDGDNNDGFFSTYPSSIWKYYDRNYQYDKEIYYDFK